MNYQRTRMKAWKFQEQREMQIQKRKTGKNKKMEREVERRTKLGVERVGERSHLRGETRTKLGVERVGERSQLRGETKAPKVVKGIIRVLKIRRTRVVNQRRRVENQRSQAQNKTQKQKPKEKVAKSNQLGIKELHVQEQ